MFSPSFTGSNLLTRVNACFISFYLRDYHPVLCDFPDTLVIFHENVYRANPLSLAATDGISVDFFSCSY
jgi:hypothetical protein